MRLGLEGAKMATGPLALRDIQREFDKHAIRQEKLKDKNIVIDISREKNLSSSIARTMKMVRESKANDALLR